MTSGLQSHPALCFCYPLGESPGDSHTQGITLENTALMLSFILVGGSLGSPRGRGLQWASLCLPPPPPCPTQRWAVLRKPKGSDTFRMTDVGPWDLSPLGVQGKSRAGAQTHAATEQQLPGDVLRPTARQTGSSWTRTESGLPH